MSTLFYKYEKKLKEAMTKVVKVRTYPSLQRIVSIIPFSRLCPTAPSCVYPRSRPAEAHSMAHQLLGTRMLTIARPASLLIPLRGSLVIPFVENPEGRKFFGPSSLSKTTLERSGDISNRNFLTIINTIYGRRVS